ncbi:hypothetical protein L204_104248 [Cryptococcus depauperatus]
MHEDLVEHYAEMKRYAREQCEARERLERGDNLLRHEHVLGAKPQASAPSETSHAERDNWQKRAEAMETKKKEDARKKKGKEKSVAGGKDTTATAEGETAATSLVKDKSGEDKSGKNEPAETSTTQPAGKPTDNGNSVNAIEVRKNRENLLKGLDESTEAEKASARDESATITSVKDKSGKDKPGKDKPAGTASETQPPPPETTAINTSAANPSDTQSTAGSAASEKPPGKESKVPAGTSKESSKKTLPGNGSSVPIPPQTVTGGEGKPKGKTTKTVALGDSAPTTEATKTLPEKQDGVEHAPRGKSVTMPPADNATATTTDGQPEAAPVPARSSASLDTIHDALTEQPPGDADTSMGDSRGEGVAETSIPADPYGYIEQRAMEDNVLLPEASNRIRLESGDAWTVEYPVIAQRAKEDKTSWLTAQKKMNEEREIRRALKLKSRTDNKDERESDKTQAGSSKVPPGNGPVDVEKQPGTGRGIGETDAAPVPARSSASSDVFHDAPMRQLGDHQPAHDTDDMKRRPIDNNQPGSPRSCSPNTNPVVSPGTRPVVVEEQSGTRHGIGDSAPPVSPLSSLGSNPSPTRTVSPLSTSDAQNVAAGDPPANTGGVPGARPIGDESSSHPASPTSTGQNFHARRVEFDSPDFHAASVEIKDLKSQSSGPLSPLGKDSKPGQGSQPGSISSLRKDSGAGIDIKGNPLGHNERAVVSPTRRGDGFGETDAASSGTRPAPESEPPSQRNPSLKEVPPPLDLHHVQQTHQEARDTKRFSAAPSSRSSVTPSPRSASVFDDDGNGSPVTPTTPPINLTNAAGSFNEVGDPQTLNQPQGHGPEKVGKKDGKKPNGIDQGRGDTRGRNSPIHSGRSESERTKGGPTAGGGGVGDITQPVPAVAGGTGEKRSGGGESGGGTEDTIPSGAGGKEKPQDENAGKEEEPTTTADPVAKTVPESEDQNGPGDKDASDRKDGKPVTKFGHNGRRPGRGRGEAGNGSSKEQRKRRNFGHEQQTGEGKRSVVEETVPTKIPISRRSSQLTLVPTSAAAESIDAEWKKLNTNQPEPDRNAGQRASTSPGRSRDNTVFHRTVSFNPFTLMQSGCHILKHAPLWSLCTAASLAIYIEMSRQLFEMLAVSSGSAALTKRASAANTPSDLAFTQSWFSDLVRKLAFEPLAFFAFLSMWNILCIPLVGLLIHRTLDAAAEPKDKNPDAWWRNPYKTLTKAWKGLSHFCRGATHVVLLDRRISGPINFFRRNTLWTYLRMFIFVAQVIGVVLLLRQAMNLAYMVGSGSQQSFSTMPDVVFPEKSMAGVAASLDARRVFAILNFLFSLVLLTLAASWYALLYPRRGSLARSEPTEDEKSTADRSGRWSRMWQRLGKRTMVKWLFILVIIVTFIGSLLYFRAIAAYFSKQSGSNTNSMWMMAGVNAIFACTIGGMGYVVYELEKLWRRRGWNILRCRGGDKKGGRWCCNV